MNVLYSFTNFKAIDGTKCVQHIGKNTKFV